MATSTLFLVYAGLSGSHGWWLWIALGLLGVETAVFVGNGMKCPWTALAVSYGAEKGCLRHVPAGTPHALHVPVLHDGDGHRAGAAGLRWGRTSCCGSSESDASRFDAWVLFRVFRCVKYGVRQ
jgi:hypothetical protein